MNESETASLAFVGGTIIDGNGGDPISDGVLVVEGQRISAVGGPLTPIPPGAAIIGTAGRFIIPGIMDANVYLLGDIYPVTLIRYENRYDELALEAAQVALTNGITTVFDTYGPRKQLIQARDAINDGRSVGSRIYLAGACIGFGGPYSEDFFPKFKEGMFDYANELNKMWSETVGPELMWMSLDEIRATIRNHANSGVDFLRFAVNVSAPAGSPYIAFSPRIQRLIVEEGHRAGITVQGHTTSVEGIHLAVEAGVDILQHPDYTGPTHVMPPETIDMLLERRMPCALRASLNEALPYLRRGGEFYEIGDRNQRAMISAGANVLLSTGSAVLSANTRGMPPLVGVPYEILLAPLGEGHFNWLLAVEQRGMKPMDALMAATRNVARAYKLDKDLGTLEPGKVADVVILEKNPLERAVNYRSIAQVVKEGRLVDRSKLPTQRLLTASAR